MARLHVHLDDGLHEKLKQAAEHRGVPIKDIVRDMVEFAIFMDQHPGAKLLIREPDGRVLEVVGRR